MDGFLLVENNDRKSESAELDHTACMCSLIMLYILRKINASSRTKESVPSFT